MLLNTVTGSNTKLKAYFICCRSIGVEPSQNLELIVCPHDPISGNSTSISGTAKFSEARKVVGKTRKEVTSYEGKGTLLTKDLITWFAKWYWCFLWQRQENNKLVGSLESTKQLWVLLERHAICQTFPCQNRLCNYQIYWTQFYQGNNFYNNYNKK